MSPDGAAELFAAADQLIVFSMKVLLFSAACRVIFEARLMLARLAACLSACLHTGADHVWSEPRAILWTGVTASCMSDG